MKVILTEDVKGLGKANDLVNVKDGYAKNFLFKNNLAVPADQKNINIMKDRLESDKLKKDRLLNEASDHKEQLDGKKVELYTLAGEGGRLFGSITTKDIADAINKQLGIEVDRRKIQLDNAVKNIGQYDFIIKIHADIAAKMSLDVKEKE